MTSPALRVEELDFLGRLDPPGLLGDRGRVMQSNASLEEREERRRSEPVDRDSLATRPELPDGGERLLGPDRRF